MADNRPLPAWLETLPRYRMESIVNTIAPTADAHGEWVKLDDLRAAWQAQEGGWQPIATAPRVSDGRRVLLWSNFGAWIGDWNSGSGWFSLTYGQPTHWMPLPAPHTQGKEPKQY